MSVSLKIVVEGSNPGDCVQLDGVTLLQSADDEKGQVAVIGAPTEQNDTPRRQALPVFLKRGDEAYVRLPTGHFDFPLHFSVKGKHG